jgi:hypothetical protein
MASFLWTFETETVTGLEADTDTIGGIDIQSLGDGTGADAVPCPTVPGETGNGRLLASANHYNTFSTAKEGAMLHTSGQTFDLSFQWKPLLDYDGGLAGTEMLVARYLGFISGGAVGNTYIETYIVSEATTGLYTFTMIILGFYIPPTTFNFTGIPLTIRDWNLIEVSYDGANALTLTVNGALVGSIGPTMLPMPTTTLGQLMFDKNGTASIAGVLDTVSLIVS